MLIKEAGSVLRGGSRGWPVIWHGLEYGPALVVLDVAGGPRWADLPPAWREHAATHQIAWCRVDPGVEHPYQVEDVMETLADRNVRTRVVAAGPLTGLAHRVAEQFDVVEDVTVCAGPVAAGPAPEPLIPVPRAS